MKFFKNINFDKLKHGLDKTREKVINRISETLTGKAKIDESTLDEIEEILVTGDIGYEIASQVIEAARSALKKESDRSGENIFRILKQELKKIITSSQQVKSEYDLIEKFRPYVILVVGVNGAGKTTTIGKLARNYKNAGLNVIIGSADTFRAAANEQLEIWAGRAGVQIVQSTMGADPSSVVYDTLNIAVKNKADIVLIDTAGRLHTKSNLMEELSKIKRVMTKVLDYAPNETFLVIDGNTGQNGLIQAKEFAKVTDISGLILTKLDGTAKGGVVFKICSENSLPIKYIGVGEGIDDLQTFDPDEFINALFTTNNI